MVFKILMPRDSLYYSRERNFVLMKKNFPRFLDWRSVVDGRSVCSSKTKVSRYVSSALCWTFSRNFVRLRSIDRGHRESSDSFHDGIRVIFPKPYRGKSDCCEGKIRGRWLLVVCRQYRETFCNRQVCFLVFLSVCNGDCVRIERCSGNTKPMINRLLLFLSFVLLACNL